MLSSTAFISLLIPTSIFFSVSISQKVIPHLIDLNELGVDNTDEPLIVPLKVNNINHIAEETILNLSRNENLINNVVTYLNNNNNKVVFTSKNITLSILPIEGGNDISIKVMGCDYSENNKVKNDSYLMLRGTVAPFDDLVSIDGIEISSPEFSLLKFDAAINFTPTLEGDYGEIINDFEFNQSIVNALKTINPNVTENDYDVLFTGYELITQEKELKIYNLDIDIISKSDSTNIIGTTSFNQTLKLVKSDIVSQNISSLTMDNNIIVDVLVNDVATVASSEIANGNNDKALKDLCLKKIRTIAPYAVLNDFVVSVTADAGNYNNPTFSKTCNISITAAEESYTINGGFNFTATLKVHEATIHGQYSSTYYIGFNPSNSNTFNIAGHADVKVTLIGIDVNFTWDVPKNLAITGTYNLMDIFYNTGYVTKFTANWTSGSYIYTDVDSMAEMAGQHDERNQLDDVNMFLPVAPRKNDKDYFFGHRRNGKPIESTTTFQSTTPQKAPTDNMPDIWVSNNAGGSNWSAFWNSINLTIESNYKVSTNIPSASQLVFYVSSLDNNRAFNITDTRNEQSFNAKTGAIA